MLVLSRKTGESIHIDNVIVTVVRLDRNRVRIGIEAPAEMKIVRGELLLETAVVSDELTAEAKPETQSDSVTGGVA